MLYSVCGRTDCLFVCSYPVTPRRGSALSLAHFGALSLWTLYAACPVFPDAARGITFFESILFDLPVQGLVPSHAGGVLGAQVDQGDLKKKRKKKNQYCI